MDFFLHFTYILLIFCMYLDSEKVYSSAYTVLVISQCKYMLKIHSVSLQNQNILPIKDSVHIFADVKMVATRLAFQWRQDHSLRKGKSNDEEQYSLRIRWTIPLKLTRMPNQDL
jgi:hypothetical protein